MANISEQRAGRVVVTGLGIASCLGSTLESVTSALERGESGIILDEERKQRGFRSALTARRPTIDLRARGLGRKQLRTMEDPARFAYAATIDALEDAGLAQEHLAELHTGIVFGNDSCILPAVEGIREAEKYGETKKMGAGSIFQAMNSTVTMNLATILGLTGANWTMSAACASGAHAIGQGFMLIRSGLQRVVLCGGAQEISWQATAAFDALGAFSTREDDPTRASRPFSQDRDGLVPSGGGACLVLEDWEYAHKRGARVYGEIAGYGFSSDGYHLSKPKPEGGMRAVQMALKIAGISPEEIDYVNAHATSTPQGDASEAQLLSRVFPSRPPISSTKSMTGHECWMAGASELVYSFLMARHGFVAPNINFEGGDEYSQGLDIITQTREAKIRYFLSNSLGFGGTNAALVVKCHP